MGTTAFRMALPIDRVTAIALEPGARFEVHGLVSSADGSAFDAARLFDFAAGGLQVELEHIESVLRRVTLRVGPPRRTATPSSVPSLPMADEMVAELELRDQAIADAEAT